MTLPYIETPEDSTRNLLDLMNLVKLQDTKLMPRNLLHSYMLTMKDQKQKLRKQSIYHHNKRIKYQGINLPKKAKDPYSENYKTLMKEIKEDRDRKIYHVLGLEESI